MAPMGLRTGAGGNLKTHVTDVVDLKEADEHTHTYVRVFPRLTQGI
jgi:hypothetical protein